MNDSLLQIHEWPWSFGMAHETRTVQAGILDFPYYGSPLISCPAGTELGLAGRYEQFVAQTSFPDGASNRVFFQAPHALVAPLQGKGAVEESCLEFSLGGHKREYPILPSQDAWSSQGLGDTELERTILAWSNAFDSFMLLDLKSLEREEVSWRRALDILEELGNTGQEPRMALVVRIADKMLDTLAEIVRAARRLLARERKLLPADRITELDHVCLTWLIRQPGNTLAQKASTNRQSILGIARYETFDTLENRVLKDFLRRCRREARNYLQFDCLQDQLDSSRARLVLGFKTLCDQLLRSEHLEKVSKQTGLVTPNYVLQSDVRYKKVWEFYVRLLRQEDEEDKLWAWQNRAWNEIACFLLNCALCTLAWQGGKTPGKGAVHVRALAEPSLQVSKEQVLGCRLLPGGEPGPFLVEVGQGRWVLEIVHCEQMGRYPRIAPLGRIGAWQYLVLSPVGGTTLACTGSKTGIIAVWPVHQAASRRRCDTKKMWLSAHKALEEHTRAIDRQCRQSGTPFALYGLVLGSTSSGGLGQPGQMESEEQVVVTMLQSMPDKWKSNVQHLAGVMEILLVRSTRQLSA